MTAKIEQLALIEREPLPSGPPHPAEVIELEMKERRWKIEDLALAMAPQEQGPGGVGESMADYGMNYLALEIYLACKDLAVRGEARVRLDSAMSAALGRAFEMDPDHFSNLEAAWLASRTN